MSKLNNFCGTCSILLLAALAACSQAPKEPVAKTEKAPVPAPVYFKVDAATAGTLTGRIAFTGKRPARKKIDISEDPQCAKLHPAGLFDEALVVNPNGTLANVFVYIKEGLEGKTFEPPAEPVTIDQSGCRFQPRVFGIQTAQLLQVTNSDPVTHNIHPLAQVNRAWNQSQDPGSEPLKRRFKEREVMIRVKCNIHSWMRAWIGAVEHPYFAVTGTTGAFELKNIPPGDYTLEVWHEQLGTQVQKVTVRPSAKEDLTFTFKGE